MASKVKEFGERAKDYLDVGKDWVNERVTARDEYWLTRWLILRVLGLTYLFAFLSLALQVIPLMGENGILPAVDFLNAVASNVGGTWEGFSRLPSIFWFHISDTALIALSVIGLLVSLVILFGYANIPMLTFQWLLYMSYVHIGQTWYGYGWEIQLLETGFLAIFLAPLWDWHPFPKSKPNVPVIWLFRWLAFRVSLGAGLIKLRGSECWDKLTCLYYHYETQPIPNPLSPYFHFLPNWFHKLGVVVTHFVQTITPFFVFLGRFMRNFGGFLMLGFQVFLMFTGNYAFLNLVTMVAIIAYFDDSWLKKIMPQALVDKAEEAKKSAVEPGRWRKIITVVLLVVVAVLSVPVIANLLSSGQAMNTSFNQLHLVNTYGAFGSVGKVRNELIIEGTQDSTIGPDTEWKEYDFPGKPGPVDEPLPVIAPYQPRVDWQIWFAAMSRPERTPWLIHYVWKLLDNDPAATKLLEENPFPDDPPEYVRIRMYRYEFAPLDSDKVWERELRGTWLQPISKENRQVRRYVVARWGG